MPIAVSLIEDNAPLREACAGGSPLTSQPARQIIKPFRHPRSPSDAIEALTLREQEVLELLVQGCLYKEIADKLQISYHTVSTHLEHIYEKLHVRSRTQAVVKYLGQNWAT